MSGYLKGGLRFGVVSVGVVLLTSFSVDATDFLGGSPSALGILVTEVITPRCPAEMVTVKLPDQTTLCADRYEVSAGTGCSFRFPQSPQETAINSNEPGCLPVSESAMMPWTQVLRSQAEQLCARAGKRLPTANEWYLAARGTPDGEQVCNVAHGPGPTGVEANCRSGVGAYDMVGGVWEWVLPIAKDGFLAGVQLPPEGYVTSVGTDGIPRTSTNSPEVAFNSDYVWSRPVGEYAVMRGGFHGSRSDGGVYSLHAATPLNFAAGTVGFRCVKSL